MALQNLDLTGPLEASTPIATIAAATRQRKTEELNQQEHALTLQRLSQQIQESKKKADDEKAITDIIKAGGEPQEVSKRLLEAGYPDASRTYLTNSQADVLQAQQQALLRAKTLEGQVAPEVTAVAPQAQMAPIQTSLTDQTQTAVPAAPPQPQTQQVPTPLPSVDVPFIGQPSTTIRPQSAQQLTLAERAKAEFNAGLEARKKASEPTIIPANASVLQNGVVTTPNPKQEPAEVKFSNDGIPYAVIGSDKVTRTIGDPNMPAADKKLADKAIADHAQAISEKVANEDKLNANSEKRAEAAAARAEERATVAAARADARQKEAEKIKNSTAPEAVKTQVNSAYQTKDTIAEIRDLVKAKPYLVGPAIGRAEQAAQGIGSTFGFQNPADEQDAATLATNFGNLLINEARTASPGRSSKELLQVVKDVSATIKQNPNMLEGHLKGIEQNANVAIKGGKRWGIDISGGSPSTGGLKDVSTDELFKRLTNH